MKISTSAVFVFTMALKYQNIKESKEIGGSYSSCLLHLAVIQPIFRYVTHNLNKLHSLLSKLHRGASQLTL